MANGSKFFIICISVLALDSQTDDFYYNTYNNHGVLGLINLPSARLYEEGSTAITVYDGTPDQKITITASPYDWLEASFFYTNIQGRPYGNGFNQDYKDKGFNFKIRLKKEGRLPAFAIGINDMAGTGYFSSEYIVGSYGIGNLDINFGLGWGELNGTKDIKNPLTFIDDRFKNRTDAYGQGGQFVPSRYFSGESVSPFYGIAYAINSNLILKIEHDTTSTPGKMEYEIPSNRTSIGLDYTFKNITVGISQERNNNLSFRFSLKKNASAPIERNKYKKAKKEKNENKYQYLIKNLELNGIGVNKVVEAADSIGIEITQFNHPNLDFVENIIYLAKQDSGITKDIKPEYRITDLEAYSELDQEYLTSSKLIYERERSQSFNTSSRVNVRPFIAAREGFFKYAILFENNSEYIIKDNFFFSSNLKYSIDDNFDDLVVPPVDTFPAQVRSDIKEYLRNFNNRVIIGRAQFDYHITPKKNNHLMFSAGILEEMFSGYGFEYLYFDNRKKYAIGFETFMVKKRDYKLRFGSLNYKNTTSHLNFYYRNYDLIPFDAKISYGEYLAGDTGATFEISRSYLNGAKFGIFASFTDVSSSQFGEGSFDKGIFFNIPVYGNFIDYTWRPLTKDPGAKLLRKYSLHDLLIKFKPYNN